MCKKCAQIMFFLAGSAMTFAISYVGMPKGTIHHAFVEYVDANSITITAGYGECSGNYFEVTESQVYDVNYIPTGEDFIYIYVDDSESAYPVPSFCDSTVEPAWSDSKLGWYNGDDRCIGVLWTEASSSEVKYFTNNSNNKIVGDFKDVLYHVPISTNWTTAESTAYIPINAKAVYLKTADWDQDGTSYVEVWVASYENDDACVFNIGYKVAACAGWIELERDCSRDLKYRGYLGNDNLFSIMLLGYQIER